MGKFEPVHTDGRNLNLRCVLRKHKVTDRPAILRRDMQPYVGIIWMLTEALFIVVQRVNKTKVLQWVNI